MRTCSNILLAVTVVLTSCQYSNDSQTVQLARNPMLDSLEMRLIGYNDTKVLPGFAVSIFTKDSILYEHGFGLADVKTETPYTVDKVQPIASVTKTLVGVALMKCVEDKLLKLDDPINDILPYRVFNPNFPQEQITVRMLAAHTSSISDTRQSDKGYRFESPLLTSDFPEAYAPLLENYNQAADISMTDFLRYKLEASGKWYEKDVFANEKPGSAYEYSNLGIALLARIIEIKTNKAFDKYTESLILQPLNMQRSTWNIADISAADHARHYNEWYREVPYYSIVTYPDGGLYSSVSDMTVFLQEMMKGYEGKGGLLTAESYSEMMKKQFEGQEMADGVCWDLSFDGLIGHAGNDFGTATLMYFSPLTGIGRVLFTNISVETDEQEAAFYGVFNALFEYNIRP